MDLQMKLQKKLQAEYDAYIKYIMTLEKSEIIAHSNIIHIKQLVLSYLEELGVDESIALYLLSLKELLTDIAELVGEDSNYEDWIDRAIWEISDRELDELED